MRCYDFQYASGTGNVLLLNEGGRSLVFVFVMVVDELWRCEEDDGVVVLHVEKVEAEFGCLTMVVGGA